MYSSNDCCNDLISSSSYPNQPFFSSSNRPFSIDSNLITNSTSSSSCALLSPFSFFQFPSSPLDQDHEIFLHHHHHDLLHHHHHQSDLADEEVAANVNKNMESNNDNIIPDKAGQGGTDHDQKQIPIIIRRRSSKRDRHSKIKTAKGLRDRRMRLSLEVAKRFFGLQDMLGFDKASKTVEWLLNQAKLEIKQLAARDNNLILLHHDHDHHRVNSASSTSECTTEAVSSLDEVAVVSGNQEQLVNNNNKGGKKRRRVVKVCRKSALKQVDKESRGKARERARERTKMKMKMRMMRSRMLAAADADDESMQCNDNNDDEGANHNNNNLNQLAVGSSWNPFETTAEECAAAAGSHQSQSVVDPSLDAMTHHQQHHHEEVEERRSSQGKEHLGTIVEDIVVEHEDPLVIMSRWSPNMIYFNSLNHSGILQEVNN
ncbi:hypothetical protein RIF29_07809 [Crotalaria pallida]|uniref:Uncharacterized protein n=1 Tax=Crotalaria pallida TaxID=3830 RepID=A0AAN9J4H9_CROPI